MDASQVSVGDRVRIQAKGNFCGVVRFLGETKFREGIWVGVELDSDAGKNDGSVNGVQYFKCKANHGVFIRPTAVVRQPSPGPYPATQNNAVGTDKVAIGGRISREPVSATPRAFARGQRLAVFGENGTVQFAGSTKFAEGHWIGIEFDNPVGQNSGSIDGEEYFNCAAKHGVFMQSLSVESEALLPASKFSAASTARSRLNSKAGSPRIRTFSMNNTPCLDDEIITDDSLSFTLQGPDGAAVTIRELLEALEQSQEEVAVLVRQLEEAGAREETLKAELAFAGQGLAWKSAGREYDSDPEYQEEIDLTSFMESF
eukprot:TRINITY_DN50938_c0_g1_i1.p1 TRINITY_DN50938_c0_g1~~TRINITY_DN50938_c0_g1_i1.p1  ORF type:complete len:322 (+),score=61.81 TRINITY_DN50938_c0_g1_i1:22-966(+)